MIKSERVEKIEKRIAQERMERQREIEVYPLSQYSTSQIKEELRRRKKER